MQEACARAAALPGDGTQGWDGAAEAALQRLLGIFAGWLFLENSRPVHRAALSGLQRLPPRRLRLFQDAVLQQVPG
jgi:hypothetical protein